MPNVPFPAVLDSTILAAFRSCPQKAFRTYFQHYKPRQTSIHLHAGAAYAAGLEAARLAFFSEGKSEEDAKAIGLQRLIEAYGTFECPPDSAKSLERMCGALAYYLECWPLSTDKAVPITLPSGKRGVEFSFTEPIDFPHPETGDPLLYVGRMDTVVDFAGAIYGEDDKTTSQLGTSWSRQWDLRCFHPDHQLLTRDGWKRITRARGEVMQADEAGNLSFARPTDRTRANYEGDLISISGPRLQQLVTPNHRILLHTSDGRPLTVLAGDLPSQDASCTIPTGTDACPLAHITVTKVRYRGPVYCVTVPAGYVLTRLYGATSISGNSQFTGYTWGAKRSGIPLAGFLIRGVSILKTKYDHAEAITYRPQWMIDRWYEQLLRDVRRMQEMWESGVWDYNLDHACAEYGGCDFRQICLSADPEPWLRMNFEQRRWDPVRRTEE